MGIRDKTWHVYLGGSWIGTLTPTGADDDWYYAEFTQGDAWGNFAPWFEQCLAAHEAEDDTAWESWYMQITSMGLTFEADDGESYDSPVLVIDGSEAWFIL